MLDSCADCHTRGFCPSRICISCTSKFGIDYYIIIIIIMVSEFYMFNVCSSSENCPSARCDVVAANVVRRDADIFATKTLSLNHVLLLLLLNY
jgi:hypothetical protein